MQIDPHYNALHRIDVKCIGKIWNQAPKKAGTNKIERALNIDQ